MEEKKSRSQFMMVLKRLSKNRMAILGLIILLLLIIMGIFADFIAPYGYAEESVSASKRTALVWHR